MKKLNILKLVLDFILLLAITGVIGVIIAFIFNLSRFNLQTGTEPFGINTESLPLSNLGKINLFLMVVMYSSFYFYCIYLFRKVIIHFQNSDFFNDDVIKLLNWIGKLILFSPFINIVYHFISNVITFLFNLFKKNRLELTFDFEFNFDFFGDSFFITITLGFFFMVMSEVFKIAKLQKEENDLTI